MLCQLSQEALQTHMAKGVDVPGPTAGRLTWSGAATSFSLPVLTTVVCFLHVKRSLLTCKHVLSMCTHTFKYKYQLIQHLAFFTYMSLCHVHLPARGHLLDIVPKLRLLGELELGVRIYNTSSLLTQRHLCLQPCQE